MHESMRANALALCDLVDLEPDGSQVAVRGLEKVKILTIFAWHFALGLATTERSDRYMAIRKIFRRWTRKLIEDDHSPTPSSRRNADSDTSHSQYGAAACTIRRRTVGPL
jgi:hypothetical protein